VLRLELKPAQLVRVQGRTESVLVDLELFDEVPVLNLVGGEIDVNRCFAFAGLHEFSITDV
jgi:hypothetical protein